MCVRDRLCGSTALMRLLVILLGLIITTGDGAEVKQKLNIAGFLPVSKNSSHWRVGQGVLPAVMQAINDINKNPDILPEYELTILWNDTRCQADYGIKAFLDMVHRPPVKIILFGDACSTVTEPISKAAKRYNLVQLSYADMHPMYTKQDYPNLFRIVPSAMEFNEQIIDLIRHFNWTRLGTLHQNIPEYSLPHDALVNFLESSGNKPTDTTEVIKTRGFAESVYEQMLHLKQSGVKIILGNFNETWARQIFCEAYHHKMYGKLYHWVIPANYDSEWWRVPDTNCSLQDIEIAIHGALLLQVLPISTSDVPTISGRTSAEYNYIYEAVSMGIKSRFHGYAYDGMWAIALALHNVSNFYNNGKSKNEKLLLNNFHYRDALWEQAILQSLEATNFIGVTGPVSFQENGRKGSTLIKQLQIYNTAMSEVEVGQYDSVTKVLNLTSYSTRITGVGDETTKDHSVEANTVSNGEYHTAILPQPLGFFAGCFVLNYFLRAMFS